ncbi:hypothetical protein DEA8626_01864 [Defluviimonas aquaemixtae]|uniref:Chlorhexidine efflux transporter domain-containing protein n=1 Tax=Albidovulum aquaemixtae TaxID=1542388 RepID=A0A2R8B6U3_9RHOB|nr:chlorhexidine efflux transporter [Defluviimonas aquaemixtae]SPH18327.1 hypothetical protein DEA8626_01864 [Defluviimonas aquaemixtae]
MALRSVRERVLQTPCLEGGGLILAVPAYALIMGRSGSECFLLMALLSVTVMIWSPIHNTVFDLIDLHVTGRLASDRPNRLRMVHALSHESTAVIMTLTVLVLLGRHSFRGALAVGFTLTIACSIYAYLFHLGYDRLRPASGIRVRVNDLPNSSRENASTVSSPVPDSWT